MKKRIILTETQAESITADNQLVRGHQSESQPDNSLIVFDIFQQCIRNWKRISLIVIAVMVCAGGLSLLMPNQYASIATILPTGAPDKIQELKSLAGLGNLTSSNDNPSELFPSILASKTVADGVLKKNYAINDKNKVTSLTLAEYFDQGNSDKLYKLLAGITSVSPDKKTGLITLSVETKNPGLSQQLNQAYLAELESFNMYKRRSQARENVEYLSKQVEATRADLNRAERDLENFQNVNRNWSVSSDPEAQRIVVQLQREFEIQNKKFLYLTQEHEMAKLEMHKDVPVVSILDQPSLPTQKSSPHRLLIACLAGFMGLLMTIFGISISTVLKYRLDDNQQAALKIYSDEIRKSIPVINKFTSSREEIKQESIA
jgi:uncharacterized protein involved in exopolysaccharide biosynthesis